MSEQDKDLSLLSNAAIDAMAAKITLTNITGAVNGMVWKSPPEVKHADRLIRTKGFWLYEFLFTTNEYRRIGLLPFNHGIYRDDKKFPSQCVICGQPFNHVEILEVGIPKQQFNKLTVQASQAEVDRIFFAMRNRRVWYPVPLCQDHKIDGEKGVCATGTNKPVAEGVVDEKIALRFSNRDVGRAFGELNNMVGEWRQPFFGSEVKFNDPDELDQMPTPWWKKTLLVRLPFYLLSFGMVILLIHSCANSDMKIDFTETVDWLGLLGFIGIIVFWVIADTLGHYPGGNRPKKVKTPD